VLHDEPSGHFPDRIELVVHVDAMDLTRTVLFSILLYREGRAVWRQGTDSAGPVDVAVIELQREKLPHGTVMRAFEPRQIQQPSAEVEVGASLRIVAFPLGFYDTTHQLPVVRHAIVASSFGVRFEGQGYFLTDGRMHRGTSGAPVVLRCDAPNEELPWRLLGVHSGGMDMRDRDASQDETLGLNCTWYADILMTLTQAHGGAGDAAMPPRPGAHDRAASPPTR
jgi:hypothetical protein